MKVDDFRHRSDLKSLGRADLAAFANQHHAEALIASHAASDHVHISRFENSQRQGTARKQHDVEGEQRNRWRRLHPRARTAASNFSCTPPKPPLLITRI